MKPQENLKFPELKNLISKQKEILEEMIMVSHSPALSAEEKKALQEHLTQLVIYFKKENDKIPEIISRVAPELKIKEQPAPTKSEFSSLPLETEKRKLPAMPQQPIYSRKESLEILRSIPKPAKQDLSKKRLELNPFDKEVLKRIEKKPKIETKKKENAPSAYAQTASKLFSKTANDILKQKYFEGMVKDLLRTYIEFVPSVYISIILFSTFLSIFAGIFLFAFFMFFNVDPSNLTITLVKDFGVRALSTFWILFIVPVATFLFLYLYPSMERKSLESKINRELPFATINMSAISSSLIEPTNIFNIIISTDEYPTLRKEFTKVLNEINIYGHDLVTALKNSSASSPSNKLSELYNGLSTTITSGGNLAAFFDKRAESLLLDYRLERERYTKTAETFIDVYISIVIAAPMILMLLLMMIQFTGMGISLAPSTISLMMIVGVAVINLLFLAFLHLKQPAQ